MTATCDYNVMIFDIPRCFNIGCKYINLYLKLQYLCTIFRIQLNEAHLFISDYWIIHTMILFLGGDLKNRPKQSSIKPSGHIATAHRLCKEQEKTNDELDLEKLLEFPESK